MVKFIGKHLCQSLFCRPCIFIKKENDAFYEIFKTTLFTFYRTYSGDCFCIQVIGGCNQRLIFFCFEEKEPNPIWTKWNTLIDDVYALRQCSTRQSAIFSWSLIVHSCLDHESRNRASWNKKHWDAVAVFYPHFYLYDS